MRFLIPSVFCVLAACTSSEKETSADAALSDAAAVQNDASAPDAESLADARIPDAEVFDVGSIDATTPDAALPDASGFPDGTLVPDASSDDAGAESEAGVTEPLTLMSSAFTHGGAIPGRHACTGADLQPALEWSSVPVGTQSFALVLIDDTIDFVHWIAYNIPAGTMSLPEGASDARMLPSGSREAAAYCTQYCGPCPGSRHTYSFRLYALDVPSVTIPTRSVYRDRDLDGYFNSKALDMAMLTGTFTP